MVLGKGVEVDGEVVDVSTLGLLMVVESDDDDDDDDDDGWRMRAEARLLGVDG